MSDITNRKEVERLYRESEQRNRAILDSATDAIVTISECGIVDAFNAAGQRMFGYPAEEVIGNNISMLMPMPYRQQHDDYINNYLITGIKKVIGTRRETVGRHKDGSIFPIDLAVTEIRYGNTRVFTGIVRDVSERRKLEREVLEIASQQQRRIGQDLHDGAGQELTGLRLMTRNLIDELKEKSLPETAAAEKIDEGLKRVLQRVRTLSQGLIPVEVDAEGLMLALERTAKRVNELPDVNCSFRCDEPVRFSNNDTATHLYSIVQEAIANALRHGRAHNVVIGLEAERGLVSLKITDDGVGIFHRPQEDAGLGMRIMAYRAGLIGATLKIMPAQGGGTMVNCTLVQEHIL